MAHIIRRTGGVLLILLGLLMVAAPLLLWMTGVYDFFKALPFAVMGVGALSWGRMKLRPARPLINTSAPSHNFAGSQYLDVEPATCSVEIPGGLLELIKSNITLEKKLTLRRLLLCLATILSVLVLTGAAVLMDKTMDTMEAVNFCILLSCITMFGGGLVYIIFVFSFWKLKRALHPKLLLRTRGNLRVTPHPMGIGACITLAEEGFTVCGMRAQELVRKARHLDWGIVDYIEGTKFVLCIRDRQNDVVYRIPGYDPP